MRNAFARLYGSHPLHLLTMIAGFALLGYAVATVKPVTLWNPGVWWQSIIVWFAAAIVAHDLVLFPVYACLDRLLPRRPARPGPDLPVLNYLRVPALGAGLTLLVFLPGIIEQGAETYRAATGQTQGAFLGRWLLLTAAMFAVSAGIYAIRTAMVWRRTRAREMASRATNQPPRDGP
ncbi:hypothetical protein JF781_17980 [Mycobacterium sp. WUMAC-067]|uniref:hypothetical protein n=1 Tax=unclassified Mycobacterium TaxID=2642494 RepID=UPI001CD9E383|nr:MULTISPECIES: hypothetical protein [unclassified Mycobacterium]MCA2244258.1 hypothetical protein [Mycobacterium sp. WUMAC-067]MCA2314921.1 hypothetical protein [Mycobacterium sp. WUMAC-025]